MAETMRAVVARSWGGPEVLRVEEWPRPEAGAGEVLIEVKAFGVNRSEMFTRQGQSPGVALPRVLGIEAVGVVAAAPGGEFAEGDVVLTAMGGMGRQFDGGYAEFVKVPAGQVQRVETTLGWEVLGALPEMLQTAWGSLFRSLRLKDGETLLVRGATTSVGMAAAAIAKKHGAGRVLGTTRNAGRAELLRKTGVDEVVVDDGTVATAVRELHPEGVDKVLEMIGVTTLEDSLRCAKEGGLVCMTGIVGNKWSFDDFNPMEKIPTAVGLTAYAGESRDFLATPLQELVRQVEDGSLAVQVGKVFRMEEIVEAHRLMEENKAGGKIVVLTGR